ncbi:MAG TPA: class I SAM-dependent methyltransferase family protein [Nitrososphaeraceae archaeon]|nr:class I SAM-dependent methyltransferase family protein [Nitrososphaeraceae archaeon]
MSDSLTPDEISLVYSAFDVIGSIVIVKIPDALKLKKQIIGEIILQNIKPAQSVFAQTSAVRGDYRIRSLEFIAGEYNTVTEYREHGCRFRVDIQNTYFSPRLSTERLRIAKLISENEVIANMFAGVGTFSIIIAKINKTCKIYSIDSNPFAHEISIINTKLNRVQDRVMPICGNAKDIIHDKIQGQCNRVLMPLPERSSEFVDSAVLALKGGTGIVHFFAHIKANSKNLAREKAELNIETAFSKYKNESLHTRVVREVGPRLYQTVSDVYITQ